MPDPVPGKGRLLNGLSAFWLRFIENAGICGSHLLSTDAGEIPEAAFGPGSTSRADLAGRCTIARRAAVVPIECVVRGYLEGSGWKEYRETGRICGLDLPRGLRHCDRLPAPVFTPATKEALGAHDQNISFERASEIVGQATMEKLRSLSLSIYERASQHALSRGIIIADTKFEFGFAPATSGDPELIIVDEALTPDSARFWPADRYIPGQPQTSFDKQYLREYLENLVASGVWNKQAPGPSLPPEVTQATYGKYAEAWKRLTA